MSEALLVRHCAPTLADLKTANMFSCAFETEEQMREHLRKLNRMFVKKGLCAIPLRYRNGKALVYVFRPERLKADLCDQTACSLLRERGYCCEDPSRCVHQLIRRIEATGDVPHEIGLFLGYPPEDVHGFMENRTPCKCAGPWKVYGDAEKAQALFDQYKECTRFYCDLWENGASIDHLAVKS